MKPQWYEDIASGAKNELMSAVIRSVGSELTRPLDLIGFNFEYIDRYLKARDMPLEEPAQMALADIRDSITHLNRLIENFMELTATLNGAVEPELTRVDLACVLRCVCADSKEISRAIGIELSYEIEEGYPIYITADRVFAERVCLNLLSNSLHACTTGGHVTFGLKGGETEHVLTLIDDGCGFPIEHMLSAFEPMQSADGKCLKEFARGAGIGLYLCGEYCRLMGWHIAITPANPGTCITIRIPAEQNIAQGSICFRGGKFNEEMQNAATRVAVVKELSTVPGLNHLKR